MGHETELLFLEKDDEYMYFEVFHDHVSQGTIYINRIKPVYEKPQKSDFSKLIVPPKQSEWKEIEVPKGEGIQTITCPHDDGKQVGIRWHPNGGDRYIDDSSLSTMKEKK